MQSAYLLSATCLITLHTLVIQQKWAQKAHRETPLSEISAPHTKTLFPESNPALIIDSSEGN